MALTLIDSKKYITVAKSLGKLSDYHGFDRAFDYSYPLEKKKERTVLEITPNDIIIIKYLAMKLSCIKCDESMEVFIKIQDEHKNLFKSEFLLEAVNDSQKFDTLIGYVNNIEFPAIVNFYRDKYDEKVAVDLLNRGSESVVWYRHYKVLEVPEEFEIAKYIWKMVTDLTI